MHLFSAPDSSCQKRTVRSWDPVTMVFPSLKSLTVEIGPSWPPTAFVTSPEAVFQRPIVLSQPPTAIRDWSDEIDTALIRWRRPWVIIRLWPVEIDQLTILPELVPRNRDFKALSIAAHKTLCSRSVRTH